MGIVSNQIGSDSDLIKGCLKGDRKMQHLLYERFAPKMYGVCLRYAGNAEEARDILQEAFVKVYNKIGSFRGEGSLEGWVRRIITNTAIEILRRKSYLQPITEVEENTIENDEDSVLEALATKELVNVIQKLAPGYRAVFNMYVVEGYSHKEIARALGITEGTSKSQLSRAKIVLQDMVKDMTDKRKQVP